MGWSNTYKKSIDCNNPKGFQRARARKEKEDEKRSQNLHSHKGSANKLKNALIFYSVENPRELSVDLVLKMQQLPGKCYC